MIRARLAYRGWCSASQRGEACTPVLHLQHTHFTTGGCCGHDDYPGAGGSIIAARRETRLCDLSQLKALGVTTGWAAPYVLLDGRAAAVQLALW